MRGIAREVHQVWKWVSFPAARHFAKAMKDIRNAQLGRLMQILHDNAGTRFGRAHDFVRIKKMEDYRAAVPIREWEEFDPWIKAIAQGETQVLTRDEVLAFLPTSGSTAGMKLIPWTRGLAQEVNRAIGAWVYGMMCECPRAWQGPVYWSISPRMTTERTTPGGIPVGFDNDTGYLSRPLRYALERVLAVPQEVCHFEDWQAWQYITLLFLLICRDLSLISIWSPTFLTALFAPVRQWLPYLVRDIADGTLSPPGRVDEITARRLRRKFRQRPERAKELERALLLNDFAYTQLWPSLAAISCWTSAASHGPAQSLARAFPGVHLMPKGLIATEGIVSFPVPGATAPALAVLSHFFEFEDEAGSIHYAWELRQGERYSVILTTGGGLYRYRLHDVVTVVSFLDGCPCLEFMGRDQIVCDLAGEKLNEAFLQSCLGRVNELLPGEWDYAIVTPILIPEPGYCLYLGSDRGHQPPVTKIAAILEQELRANCHYDLCRRTGQLRELRGVLLAKPASLVWTRYQEQGGTQVQRLGDLKPCLLDPSGQWTKALMVEDTPFNAESRC